MQSSVLSRERLALPETDPTKAVIITSQRTGSTFLVECLRSHPQVNCHHELLKKGYSKKQRGSSTFDRLNVRFNPYRYFFRGAWNPAKMMDTFYSREKGPVTAFKAMYSQLIDPRVRYYLRKHTEIRIIHLRRDNLLKQYVSNVLNKRRLRGERTFSNTKEPVPIIRTRISPARAMRSMRNNKKLFEHYEMLFSKHRKITLVYETMIEGQSLSETAAAAVCNLLKIDPAPMAGPFVKMNPDKLELIVENYNELVDALTGSEFEVFLG